MSNDENDVVVVGGGLGGLAVASYLGRAGLRVTLRERARRLGGLAHTEDRQGYLLHAGPRALYLGGPAAEVLADLGVAFTGGRPIERGSLGLRGGRLSPLPRNLPSLLTTNLLGARGKLELARLFGRFGAIDPDGLEGLSLQAWVQEVVRDDGARELLFALARLNTYIGAPTAIEASRVVRQMQRAGGTGVRYLDGGWQTLIAGLQAAAERANVRIETNAKVTSLAALNARFVVLAVDPATAFSLLDRPAPELHPVRAACLDIALRTLPEPTRCFALGIDAAVYASVHSSCARLAPEGGAVLHTMRYLDPLAPPSADTTTDTRAELEALVDALQPGWRAQIVPGAEPRYRPQMIVMHALPGFDRRPAVDQGDVYLVGDWVDEPFFLTDAVFSSARRAAQQIAARAGLRLQVAA